MGSEMKKKNELFLYGEILYEIRIINLFLIVL